MKILEYFLELVFALLVIGMPLLLVFALIADALGWYDDVTGVYIGPFSKARREKD